MRSKVFLALSAILFSLFFAASTFAAQHEGMKSDQQKMQQKMQQQKMQGVQNQQDQKLFSTNWLIGNKVLSQQGQDLGEITDVLMAQQTGEAAYLIVSEGGFMNVVEDRHLVPYKALQIKGNQIILNIDKEKLAQAPRPEQGLTVEEFDRRSSEFFGVSPFWE